MPKITQTQTIVDHVARKGCIDSWTAIRTYGITRLAARIHDLKGTQNEMVGVRSPKLPKGFVLYVPNIPARVTALQAELLDVVFDEHATAEDIADHCVSIALKAIQLKDQL